MKQNVLCSARQPPDLALHSPYNATEPSSCDAPGDREAVQRNAVVGTPARAPEAARSTSASSSMPSPPNRRCSPQGSSWRSAAGGPPAWSAPGAGWRHEAGADADFGRWRRGWSNGGRAVSAGGTSAAPRRIGEREREVLHLERSPGGRVPPRQAGAGGPRRHPSCVRLVSGRPEAAVCGWIGVTLLSLSCLHYFRLGLHRPTLLGLSSCL